MAFRLTLSMLLPLALLLGACGDGGGEGRALDATPEDSPSEEVSDADGAGKDSGEEVDGDVREVLCMIEDDVPGDGCRSGEVPAWARLVDKQEAATDTMLQQARLLSGFWVKGSEA